MNMNVSIAGIDWKNPVTVASGTFGSGKEYSDFFDLSLLGAVTTKGVSFSPWKGNPTPRIAETCGGVINSIGLQNPGVEYFLKQDLPFLAGYNTNVIVNICGHTVPEYVEVARCLSEEEDVDYLELNVSCPNVSEGGIAFGTDEQKLKEVIADVKRVSKKPLIVKLSPNVTDIVRMAQIAESEGADALSMVNTFMAAKIDVDSRSFILANKTGGLSGPAIHPIVVRMVYETARVVNIPIIAMGGVMSGRDAIEFILAGATAVAVGTASFRYPKAARQVIEEIREYMFRYNVDDIRQLIGQVRD